MPESLLMVSSQIPSIVWLCVHQPHDLYRIQTLGPSRLVFSTESNNSFPSVQVMVFRVLFHLGTFNLICCGSQLRPSASQACCLSLSYAPFLSQVSVSIWMQSQADPDGQASEGCLFICTGASQSERSPSASSSSRSCHVGEGSLRTWAGITNPSHSSCGGERASCHLHSRCLLLGKWLWLPI